MKTIASITAIASLMASASAYAQTLSVNEERRFNLDALRALENYENCATLYGNAARMDFDMLFSDNQMHIFNDLNGFSAAPTLSVADYSELLSTKGRATQVIIKELRKGRPYYDNGEWKMDVTFDKEITYANECEILFSSRNYFGADFHMSMTLVWDPEMRQCTISRLDGERGSDIEMLPQDYSILTHTDDRDYKLRVDGDTLAFNSFGQAFFSPTAKFAFPDQDVRVKVVTEKADCHTISVAYKPKRWRFKAHYDLGMGDFYKADGDATTTSKANEMGIDLGYFFPSKSSVKFGLFFGAGLSTSELESKLSQAEYNYSTSQDVDNDQYTRHYTIQNAAQKFKFSDLVVPLYLDMDMRFSRYFSIYLDAGAKAYFSMKAESEALTGQYTTWGVYDQYGLEMRYEDNWQGQPINGFVTNASIPSGNKAELEFNKFSLDVIGRGGLRILLFKDLFLDVAASYQMSVISPYSVDDNKSLRAKGSTTDSHALMTYSTSGGEASRAMLDFCSEFKRQCLLLNIGLMYRF